MKRLKTQLFLLIFVAIICLLNQATAQVLPNKALEKPMKYRLPFDEQDLYPAKEIVPYEVWKVFSDREKNVTYKNPGSTVVKAQLAFLDEFYAVEEYTEANEQYIRIVKDPNMDGIKLSANVKDYGWIKKENMLLWEQCLVTKEKINRKAMILNTINHLKNLAEGAADLVEFRKGPSSDVEKTGETSRLYQFFFIYKTTSKFVLLGKEERVPSDEASRKQIIVGWAPRDRLTFWDHRIAVEPNWDDGAVAERKVGHKAIFLKDVPTAMQYKKGKDILTQDIIWNGDPLDKRPIGEWRRFPRLRTSGSDPSIITAGVMGEILDSEGNIIASEKKMATLQRGNNDQIDKTRQINVVFVVDGTNSVRPYFSNVSQAIKNSMKILTQSRNNFRFGIVVYRDWDEGKERLTQLFPIGHYQDAAKFLDGIQAKDVADTSQAEAVFYGLKTALRGVGMGDGETNVIILVGDAGNHHRNDLSQVSETEIVNLLTQKTCHFFVAQVHHKSHPTYREFVPQVKSLIMQSAQKIYTLGQEVRAKLNKSYPPPSWQQQGNAFKLSDGAYFGWVLPMSAGQSLSTVVLEKEISSFVNALEPGNNELVGATLKIFEDGKSVDEVEVSRSAIPYASALGPRLVDHLRKLRVPEQSLELIRGKRYQIYLPASAPLTVVGQNERLFKQVLLLSRAELHDLWESMNKLIKAQSGNLERKQMYETWLEILKTSSGDIIESELDKLSMERVNLMVFGLPSNSELLKEIRLKDIIDRQAFSDEKFREYANRIKEREEKLRHIYNQDVGQFPYSFRSSEQPYFWIDEDLIP